MKTFKFLIIAAVFFATPVYGQNSDLQGEDFDLEALPGLFEKVNTFEDLEKAINQENNNINNLDLNKDGEVDYVLIQMENENNTYVAFLRVAMSETEMQDIATIEMEKQSSVTATFQIVGDEALYGKDYILEPEGGVVDISESSSGSYGGKGGPAPYLVLPPPAVRVTICVGVFRPGFRIWISPWGFMVHPAWFHPWRPIARSTFRARSVRWHRSAYMRTAHRRSHHAHNMHKKHHRTSSAYKKSHTSSPAKSNAAKSNTKSTATTHQTSITTKSTQQKSNTQQRSSIQHKTGAKKSGKR